MSIAGKRIIITGARGAFGTAVTGELLALGARVIGLDLTPSDPGADREVIECDVRDQLSVDRAVGEAIGRLGGLDVLINNAGLGGPASGGMAPDAAALAILDVNAVGPWRVTSAAIDSLVESRGRVVIIASRMAFLGLPLAAAYGISKRAVHAYADSLRAEYGTHVKVTCVHPSFVRTPIHDSTSAAGLSVEGVSREEPLEAVVGAIVEACGAARPKRDVAPTRGGAIQIFMARHFPRLTAAIVARTLRKRLRAGAFEDAPLATGLRNRVLGG